MDILLLFLTIMVVGHSLGSMASRSVTSFVAASYCAAKNGCAPLVCRSRSLTDAFPAPNAARRFCPTPIAVRFVARWSRIAFEEPEALLGAPA